MGISMCLLPKKRYSLDAVCVGPSTPQQVDWQQVIPLLIRAKGPSKVYGFQTGDMLRARVTKGKKSGSYVGWVAIKTDGYFKITGRHGMVEGIHARYCAPIHRDDGYVYTQGQAALPPLV